MRIEWSKKARKQLKKIQNPYRDKIYNNVGELSKTSSIKFYTFSKYIVGKIIGNKALSSFDSYATIKRTIDFLTM